MYSNHVAYASEITWEGGRFDAQDEQAYLGLFWATQACMRFARVEGVILIACYLAWVEASVASPTSCHPCHEGRSMFTAQ